MLFSSVLFLSFFLPVTLLGYYLSPKQVKNYWLLLMSLIFFAWGGVSYTLILLTSISLNYFFGRAIGRIQDSPSRTWLIVGVSCNLLLLMVFKYANFVTQNLNLLFDSLSAPPIPETTILLPIGISFYTFHAISYLVDIYRGKTPAQKNIIDLALYISMFSQLIAGPIIRYSDVWLQLKGRSHSLEKFSSGVERFIIGLGKKVLLANVFAGVANQMFTSDPTTLGGLNAWMGMVCYTLQIYCDFSGYSDMAIGLGRLFGFEFMENFNFPYLASSVQDFWRRWHISLSSFFRDYVYIPLGGNRVGKARVYVNLVIVFFLTGFWHGANWTFVIWGLLHGFFMIVERLGFGKVLQKIGILSNLYTLLIVMLAWVLFRADNLELAMHYWAELFNFSNTPKQISKFMILVDTELCAAFLITLLGSFGFFKYFYHRIILPILQPEAKFATALSYFYHLASVGLYTWMLILSAIYLIAGTYNPFIYYHF